MIGGILMTDLKKSIAKPVAKSVADAKPAAVKAEPAKVQPAVKAEPAAKEEPKAEVKAAVAPKTEVKKAEPKKAEKKTAAKPAGKKAVKKETAPAAAEKKAVKKAVTANVHLQFSGKSYTNEDLMNIMKDVWTYDLNQKEEDIKSVELYVKPEESMVYYVVNGEISGRFAI